MKPRRWYSSPEVNPLIEPTPVRPQITVQLLRYGARVPRHRGPVLTIRARPQLVRQQVHVRNIVQSA